MKREIICIVCPNSCRLEVSEENGTITVTGNDCKRGIAHGEAEFTAPLRMLTTTVAIEGGTLPRLPVISTGEVPKARLDECLQHLYGLTLRAPVRCGDIVCENICNTGVDVFASRTMKQKEG